MHQAIVILLAAHAQHLIREQTHPISTCMKVKINISCLMMQIVLTLKIGAHTLTAFLRQNHQKRKAFRNKFLIQQMSKFISNLLIYRRLTNGKLFQWMFVVKVIVKAEKVAAIT